MDKFNKRSETNVIKRELAFRRAEKEKRAAELIVAKKELDFQNSEKEKRASELALANKELAYQSKEKKNRAAELVIANKELIFQNEEKEKRAAELAIANKELIFQNGEKEKRAAELAIANKELVFQNGEKEKRAAELAIANKELIFQNGEKEKRAAELVIANKELLFQNEEKEKRAAELAIANKELVFQNGEKEKRAAELAIANNELTFQNGEKEKRAAELVIANKELAFQNKEKEKRAAELQAAMRELEFFSSVLKKNATEREVLIGQLTKSLNDLKQFTYITSHNFKAPLSNLIGLLNLINDDTLCGNNRIIIDMFKTASNQLNKTINDLVDILIIRNNVNVEISNIDITELLREVLSLFALDINESKCSINSDLKIEGVFFNRTYLESILINLLSNAIKYRSEDRMLKIDIATGLNADGHVFLTIADNGLGIDLKRHRTNIFGLYQRFHSNTDGIGLGLFIVKSQIISLGGTIEVESEVEKGTTFVMTFGGKTPP